MSYVIMQYTFIDYHDAFLAPESVYENEDERNKLISEIKQAFLNNGWEGDGELGIIWLPPFSDDATDDCNGDFIWHVKQENNDVSFLAFNKTPCSSKLLDQNKSFTDEYDKLLHVETATENLYDFMVSMLKKNRERLTELRHISLSGHISNDLYVITLENIQNLIVADFNEFIDECYLQFMIHVLSHNNTDKLRLSPQKSKLQLDSISEAAGSGYGDHWLTIQQVISGLWKDFKFLPFREKFTEIRKCVDYVGDGEQIEVIYKHILIRNCIQHHGRQLEPTALKQIGKNSIEILSDTNKKINIKEWNLIQLTCTEIDLLITTLNEFLNSYESHMKSRTKSRHFLFIKKDSSASDEI